MDKDLIKKLKKLLPADSYKKGKDWRGYTVFLPVYKKGFTSNLPQIVLQRGGVMRASSYQECFEYTSFVDSLDRYSTKPIKIKRTV